MDPWRVTEDEVGGLQEQTAEVLLMGDRMVRALSDVGVAAPEVESLYAQSELAPAVGAPGAWVYESGWGCRRHRRGWGCAMVSVRWSQSRLS